MAEPPELSIDTSWDDAGHAHLTVGGEVDLATQDELRQALLDVVDKGASAVVVDLAAVGFLDSSGLAAIISPIARGTVVRVEGALPNVRRVLEVIVLDGFTVAD